MKSIAEERKKEKRLLAARPGNKHSYLLVMPDGYSQSLSRQELAVCGAKCRVSIFLLVHWPPGYKDNGSRGSMQSFVWPVNAIERTFWESASVLLFSSGS